MFKLIPKDQKFYEEFENLRGKIVSGAGELRKLMEEFPAGTQERTAALDEREKAQPEWFSLCWSVWMLRSSPR
jgi:hypothetical protein